MSSALLEIKDLKKYFPIKSGFMGRKKLYVKAVDGISLNIKKGETLGLVGESGSGKTTAARMILKLEQPVENSIYLNGSDIYSLSGSENREFKKKVNIVFQDPASSLNPRYTIYQSLERPLIIHGYKKNEAKEIIYETSEKVKLGRELLGRFPNQLSGGQQQRASIVRAIMTKPELLVLDEPTSALDVSVQAQILNVLLDLQEEYNLTYLFITHNLSVVRYMSDRICVMYAGKVVEIAPCRELYESPGHPYTFGLLSSAPPLSPLMRGRKKFILSGDPPSLIDINKGCKFSGRCPFKTKLCEDSEPVMREAGPGHFVACHSQSDLNFYK